MTKDQGMNETEECFQPGPLGNKYMEIHETIKLLEGPHALLCEIPKGRKDGIYFILDNGENIEARQRHEFQILGRLWCLEKR